MQQKSPLPTGHGIGQEILLVSLGLVLAVLVLLLVNHSIIQPAFSLLEQQQVKQDSARILGDIENGQMALAGSVNDWANWDATYAFALDRNPRYIEENNPDPAVFSRDSRIDLLAIYDLQGNLLHQGVYLPALKRLVTLQLLSGDRPVMLTYLEPVLQRGDPVDGLVVTEYGMMLISARPILPNSQKGPSRGALVMGRFLAGDSLAEIVQRTGVPMLLFTKDDTRLTDGEKVIFRNLAAANSLEHQEGRYLYRLLQDVRNEPIGLIRMAQRGKILLLGQQTGRILFTMLAVIALVFIGFAVRYRTGMILSLNALRQSKEDHRTSEELFRNIVTSSPLGMHFYRLDDAGRLIFTAANPAGDRILGIDHRVLVGKTIEQAFPKLQGTAIPALYSQVARGEKGLQFFEVPYHDNDISGIFEVYVFQASQGSVVATYLDVSERKQTEAALRESEAKYRSLSETTTMGIWHLDTRGYTLHLNPAMCDILEVESSEALAGQTYHRFFNEESLEVIARETSRRSTGVKSSYEALIIGAHGTERNILIAGAPLFDDSQKFIGTIATCADITEHKQAETAAAREKIFSDDLINALPGLFYMYDENLKLVRWTKKHNRVTGYSMAELAEMHAIDFVPEQFRKNVREVMQAIFSDGSGQVEAAILTKDGRQIPYYFTGRRTEIDGQRYLLGLGIDISQRKQAEEEREKLQAQLLQAQKMESVGRLAGGVAHDFNNMLGVILGYCELGLLQSGPDSPLQLHLEQIRNAAERSANLTQQLLAFARRQTIAPKVLDLNDTVAGMLKMLRRLIGEEIELAWLPGAGLWRVLMDPTQVDQILVNLCVNARDAVKGGGKITIETANISFDELYCQANEGCLPGDYVSLIISDTGYGMDRETIKGIFEPFFTTKEQGRGTGLGLATIYGIIKQNNASINVYSEPGRGSTFKIYLPRVLGDEDEAKVAGPGGLPSSQGETILLVEDEQTIMEMARTMLTTLKYGVLTAVSAEEAIELAADYEGTIDLLLTDVVMPGMNGRQLQEKLLKVRPQLRCLFMSGYTADVIAHQGVLDEGLFFLQKPFSLQNLAVRIREVLDHAQADPRV